MLSNYKTNFLDSLVKGQTVSVSTPHMNSKRAQEEAPQHNFGVVKSIGNKYITVSFLNHDHRFHRNTGIIKNDCNYPSTLMPSPESITELFNKKAEMNDLLELLEQARNAIRQSSHYDVPTTLTEYLSKEKMDDIREMMADIIDMQK